MPDYRKYYNKREIIKLDLVQNEDYQDNVILCVPKFAYDVARSMLAHYGKFRTSYAVAYGSQFYELPDDNLFDTIEASIDLFLGSRDMSCDLVTALECICDQFALQVAATNELVAATYTSSVNANYAGSPEQTAGVEGGSIPVGAAAPDTGITNRKCKAAHYIVDNINYMMFGLVTNPPPDWYDIGDTDNYLRQLGDTSSFGNLLTAVYGSYQNLASSIFGGAIDYEAIYDDIVANYEAIVCHLYQSASATDARSDFLAQLTITGDEYSFVSDMLYNNILNVLWFSVADSETQLGTWVTTVDCSACAPDCTEIYMGSYGVEIDETHFESTPQSYGGSYTQRVSIGFICPVNLLTLTADRAIAWPGGTGDRGYNVFDNAGLPLYRSDTPPASPISGVKTIHVYDWPRTIGSTFELTVTREEI